MKDSTLTVIKMFQPRKRMKSVGDVLRSFQLRHAYCLGSYFTVSFKVLIYVGS